MFYEKKKKNSHASYSNCLVNVCRMFTVWQQLILPLPLSDDQWSYVKSLVVWRQKPWIVNIFNKTCQIEYKDNAYLGAKDIILEILQNVKSSPDR